MRDASVATAILNSATYLSGKTFTAKELAEELGFQDRSMHGGLTALKEKDKVLRLGGGKFTRVMDRHPIHSMRLANPVHDPDR